MLTASPVLPVTPAYVEELGFVPSYQADWYYYGPMPNRYYLRFDGGVLVESMIMQDSNRLSLPKLPSRYDLARLVGRGE